MAATRYKKIILKESFSCPTGEQAGRLLYNIDGRSPDWRGWHFNVADGLLSVTPPNRYCTTDIPLINVRMLIREVEPAEPAAATQPTVPPPAAPAAAAAAAPRPRVVLDARRKPVQVE